MLPDDIVALVADVRSDGDIEVVLRDGDAATVQSLASVSDLRGAAVLWDKKLQPTLQRKLVTSAAEPYYRVDESKHAVLELTPSTLTQWCGRPALTQGRIYGQFEGKPTAFEKWFEKVVRRLRKHWRKNPVSLLRGYVGPAANDWFESGGLLLPMFVPPVTNDWIRVMNEQHPSAPLSWR
jgi:hypothetical protein